MYVWKLNNSLFNDNFIREEVKKEMNNILEFNENEGKTTQTYETVKTGQRGKFIALRALVKKLERSYTNTLTAHLKALQHKETNTPKRRRG